MKTKLEKMMDKFHKEVTKELKDVDKLLEQNQIAKARDHIYRLRQMFNLETD